MCLLNFCRPDLSLCRAWLLALLFLIIYGSRSIICAPLRPATVTWGGVSHNEQLLGLRAQAPYVARYMDGFVLHPLYWDEHRTVFPRGPVSPESVKSAESGLADLLQGGKNEVSLEYGLGVTENISFRLATPFTRDAYRRGHHLLDFLKHLDSAGINVNKVRLDWFPTQAMAVYEKVFSASDTKSLLSMTTGADQYWGKFRNFSPTLSNWREFVAIVHAARPNLLIGFDQPPCNFTPVISEPALRAAVPWKGFGYGYTTNVLPSGPQASLNVDFADLLNSVALQTRADGVNFSGFECDTPYRYFENNLGPTGPHLHELLLNIERSQHGLGFPTAKIIHEGLPYRVGMDQEVWDQTYHDHCMRFLEEYQAMGGRADQYVLESWYEGPFQLGPENKPGTYTNLIRDALRRIKGIDDEGRPMKLRLSVDGASSRSPVVVIRKGDTIHLRITNDEGDIVPGDARCTPLIRLKTTATARVEDAQHCDITSQILATDENCDGWFTGPLDAHQSKDFYLTLVQDLSDQTLELKAYWNPQDPSLKPRSSMTLTSSRE